MKYIFSDGTSMEWHKVLEQLRDNYSRLMYAVAYDILHDQYWADEAVADSFYRLSKNNFKIDSIICNKTRSFMIIISRQAAFRIYNAKKKDNVLYYYGDETEIEDENMLQPLTVVINHENINEMEKAVASLDPKYGDVIKMKYIKGYLDEQIASLLGIAESTVRSRLSRGRNALKKFLINRKEGDQENE